MKRIFIAGLGRSGTTITLSALYHHHQVLAFPVETKFLVEEDGFSALISAMTSDFSVAGAGVALERFQKLMRQQVTGLEDSKFKQQHELPIAMFTNYEAALDEFLSLCWPPRAASSTGPSTRPRAPTTTTSGSRRRRPTSGVSRSCSRSGRTATWCTACATRATSCCR